MQKVAHFGSPWLVLGDIPVIRYYRDKYIHDNIIASILTYHANRANDNTAITTNTTSTKPLSTVSISRYKLETSCLQCSTTGILFTSIVKTMVYWETSGYSRDTCVHKEFLWGSRVYMNLLFSTYDYHDNRDEIFYYCPTLPWMDSYDSTTNINFSSFWVALLYGPPAYGQLHAPDNRHFQLQGYRQPPISRQWTVGQVGTV